MLNSKTIHEEYKADFFDDSNLHDNKHQNPNKETFGKMPINLQNQPNKLTFGKPDLKLDRYDRSQDSVGNEQLDQINEDINNEAINLA